MQLFSMNVCYFIYACTVFHFIYVCMILFTILSFFPKVFLDPTLVPSCSPYLRIFLLTLPSYLLLTLSFYLALPIIAPCSHYPCSLPTLLFYLPTLPSLAPSYTLYSKFCSYYSSTFPLTHYSCSFLCTL